MSDPFYDAATRLAIEVVQAPEFTDDPARRSVAHDLLLARFVPPHPPEVFEAAFEMALNGAPAFNNDGQEPAVLEEIDGYKILKRLGSGGHGVVYLVEKGGRRYALKTLLPAAAVVPIGESAFTGEVGRLMVLNMLHSGVCRVETRGICNGLPYFVMEYVEGPSLAELPKPRDASEVRDRFATILSVARVLDSVHRKGRIHRDLKPQNIIKRIGGPATIVDFGIAREALHTGQTSTQDRRLGTPAYKSPEQRRGEILDGRSDIWSLAATLHFLLFKATPPANGQVAAIGPAALPGFDALSCERLHRILLDGLAQDRELRYSTAAEFALDLQRFLDGEEPAGPSQRLAAYRRFLQERYKALLPFFPGASDHLLEQVYVQVEVEAAHRAPDRDSPGEDRMRAEDVERHGRLSGRRLLEDFVTGQRAVDSASGRAPRILLHGDPGSGKTTMARRLVQRRAAEPQGPVPIFIPLAKLAEAMTDPFAFAEIELQGYHRQRNLAPPPPLQEALKSLAKKPGGLWLFLDGLDEVPPERMDAVKEQIRAWDDGFKEVAIIVGSRRVAAAAFPERWITVEVQPLSDEDRDRLLLKLLRDDPKAESRLREELTRRPSLAEMARNPLLLTMIAFVSMEAKQEGRQFPSRRVRLFGEVIQILLRRGFGPVPRKNKDGVLTRRLLQRLSLDLQRRGGEAWTEDRLYDLMWAAAGEDLQSRVVTTWSSFEAFRDDCGTNSGILGPHDGADLPWRYLHRTLREFLAAEGLKAAGAHTVAAWLASWMEAVKAARVDADKPALNRAAGGPSPAANPSVEPARWAEVYAFFCGLVDDPLPHLRDLRNACRETDDPGILSRALASVELRPRVAVDLIFEVPEWAEDDLLPPVRDSGDREAMEAALLAHVRPDSSTRTLAIIWYALESMARPPERRAFFERCHRWPEGGPPEIESSLIPAGRFLIGSPDGVGHPNEHPQHEVILTSPFRLAQTPVTVGLFKLFEGEHPSPDRYQDGEADEWPVVNTSWYEARLFTRWLGGRLPTEAEWEFACRGGTTTIWWPGDRKKDLRAVGWFDKNSDIQRHPVGRPPTPAGKNHPHQLLDMHGNVWEWCEDGLREYKREGVTDPVGPQGSARVVRGGGFRFDADRCRSAFRSRFDPRNRGDSLGFRVALPAP